MQRNYRDTTVDLTLTARGRDCTLRVAGYQGCGTPETTVLCHAPCRDDGKGFKSPDWWGAFGCNRCNDIIDGNAKFFDPAIGKQRHLTQAEKDAAWQRGIYETMKFWNEEGYIVF